MQNDRYHVHARLGSGSTGVVFRATRPSDGRQVVLKALHPDLVASMDLERLRGTVRRLAPLDLPALASGLELISWRGDLVLVREHLRGVELGTLIAGSVPPERVALLAMAEVAEALAAVLDRTGCWHGDLKPSNVFVDVTGRVRLVDFGLSAAMVGRADRTLTMHHGSVGFISPERADNQTVAQSDVFSAGQMLAWMLTGQMASRTSANPARQAQQQTQLVERVRAAGAQAGVVDLIAACTAYEPSDRPPIAEVGARLRTLASALEGPTLDTWARPIIEALVVSPNEVDVTDVGQPLSTARSAPPTADRTRMVQPAAKVTTGAHALPPKARKPSSTTSLYLLVAGGLLLIATLIVAAIAISR